MRSKSLKRYSSEETLDDYDHKKKSLKINVMRDIKSAQKLKIKRPEDMYKSYDYKVKGFYDEPVTRSLRETRRSLTFTSKNTKNLYDQESDLNSTPSNSQLNLYKYQGINRLTGLMYYFIQDFFSKFIFIIVHIISNKNLKVNN